MCLKVAEEVHTKPKNNCFPLDDLFEKKIKFLPLLKFEVR
jgi:hypothetical protein